MTTERLYGEDWIRFTSKPLTEEQGRKFRRCLRVARREGKNKTDFNYELLSLGLEQKWNEYLATEEH